MQEWTKYPFMRANPTAQKTTAPMQRSSQFLRRMLTVFLDRTAPASMKAKPHCMKKIVVESERRKKSSISMAASIRPGDILVTHSTDIGWSPYFPVKIFCFLERICKMFP